MTLEYERKSVGRKAWDDFKNLRRLFWFDLLAILVPLATAIFAAWLIPSNPVATSVFGAAIAVATFLIIATGAYLFSLVAAPYRLLWERDKTLEQLLFDAEYSDQEKSRQKETTMAALGNLIMEGNTVLKSFRTISERLRANHYDLPAESFKVWIGHVDMGLPQMGFSDRIPEWTSAGPINIRGSKYEDFVGACDRGLNFLQGIRQELRD